MNAQSIIIIEKWPSNTPEDASIYIAGNFNTWNPSDDTYKFVKNSSGLPELTLNLSVGTQIEFKFTLGSWDSVEKGASGEEISNRQYTIADNDTIYFTIENWASIENSDNHTFADNVIVLNDSFYMPQLDRHRRIWLYFPKDYETSTKSYPVIYMHDGQNLFDAATSFSGEWEVDETMNALFNDAHSTAIVVGIDNGGAERINELTPWKNPQYGGGDGDLYVKFIVETLKPYIDANYRTISDRENTAIWGSSLGGLISLYAAIEYDSIFGIAGVFSPSLWFSDSIYTIAAQQNKKYSSKIFFLAGGNEGSGTLPQECQNMINTLKANAYEDTELILKTVASGEHNEAFWREEFSEAYLWLFEGITGISMQKQTSNFNIYPNPARDTITIELSETGLFSLKIFDIKGKLVEKLKANNTIQISGANWAAGLYIIKIKYKGNTETFKLELTK